MARAQFALEMLAARLNPARRRCPYCESCLHFRLARKWLLIEARQCAHCRLIFRYPTSAGSDTQTFYDGAYAGQQATDLPDAPHLAQLVAQNFRNSPYDKAHRIEFIRGLRTGGRVLDFGAAWGYTVAQLRTAGFDAVGFEISRSRAEFGSRTLGVDLRTSWTEIARDGEESFELVYAEHSLEHLPELRAPVEGFSRLLRRNGLLVVFVPNGGGLLGRKLGTRWGPFMGESHTVAFTAEWFSRNLPSHGFEIEQLASSPGEGLGPLDGEELICVARRK